LRCARRRRSKCWSSIGSLSATRCGDEILVRVRAVELVPAEDALTSFSARRPRLTRWLADLDAVKAELKSPTLASTLELQYFDLLLRAHLKWLDGAEKALKKRVSEDRARKQEKRRRRR
jgi:5-methylcytosine-specific restriction endonuclease McrBC regulatory subunit McrC